MIRKPVLTVATLQRLNTFPWASAQQLERVLPYLSLRRVKRGAVLFSEGNPSNSLYLLISGVMKLSVPNVKGEEVLVSLIRPGELFGVTALMPEMHRAFRCEAFSDSWVTDVESDQLVISLLGVPFSHFRGMLGSAVSRWFTLLYRYIRYQGVSLQHRLIMALLEVAQKFGAQDARGTIITLRLTHGDLADLVGASRQRVTEHLQELEQQGMIVRDGRRLIVQLERLREAIALEVESVPSLSHSSIAG
ncbi:MAG: Crp/Fnr family transcriptional regulator [Candidatus Binatia bacterium]